MDEGSESLIDSLSHSPVGYALGSFGNCPYPLAHMLSEEAESNAIYRFLERVGLGWQVDGHANEVDGLKVRCNKRIFPVRWMDRKRER